MCKHSLSRCGLWNTKKKEYSEEKCQCFILHTKLFILAHLVKTKHKFRALNLRNIKREKMQREREHEREINRKKHCASERARSAQESGLIKEQPQLQNVYTIIQTHAICLWASFSYINFILPSNSVCVCVCVSVYTAEEVEKFLLGYSRENSHLHWIENDESHSKKFKTIVEFSYPFPSLSLAKKKPWKIQVIFILLSTWFANSCRHLIGLPCIIYIQTIYISIELKKKKYTSHANIYTTTSTHSYNSFHAVIYFEHRTHEHTHIPHAYMLEYTKYEQKRYLINC